MFRILLACFFALLAPSCQLQDPEKVFQLDERLSVFQISVINEKLDELCERSEGEECFSADTNEHSNKIVLADYIPPGIMGRTDVHLRINSAKIILKVSKYVQDDIFARVFMHELGHAAGCRYDFKEPGNVMFSRLSYIPSDWTAADISCMDGNYEN